MIFVHCLTLIFSYLIFSSQHCLAKNSSDSYSHLQVLLTTDPALNSSWQEFQTFISGQFDGSIVNFPTAKQNDDLEAYQHNTRIISRLIDELISGDSRFNEKAPLVIITSGPNDNLHATKLIQLGAGLKIAKKIDPTSKGLYLIVVEAGMVELDGKSISKLAQRLSHELGHIAAGHTETIEQEALQNQFYQQASRQIHRATYEIEADLIGIDLLKGKYSLRVPISNLASIPIPEKEKPLWQVPFESHPIPEFRSAAATLKTASILNRNPEFDIPDGPVEPKLAFTALYSRYNGKTPKQLIQTSNRLSDLILVSTPDMMWKYDELTKSLSGPDRTAVLELIFKNFENRYLENKINQTDYLELLAKMPRYCKVLYLKIEGLTFENWIHKIHSNSINDDHLKSKFSSLDGSAAEALFQTVFSSVENQLTMNRLLKSGHYQWFIEAILVPIFKNTLLGYVSFPGPFLETFLKNLHQLDLPGTSTEVDNLETIFRRHYVEIGKMPGKNVALAYFKDRQKQVIETRLALAQIPSDTEIVDSILADLYEKDPPALSIGKSIPKLVAFKSFDSHEKNKIIWEKIGNDFDLQLKIVKALNGKTGPHFQFNIVFSGQDNTLTKMFYQTLSSGKLSKQEELFAFKALLGVHQISDQPKLAGLMANYFKTIDPKEWSNLFSLNLAQDLIQFKTDRSQIYYLPFFKGLNTRLLNLIKCAHLANLDVPFGGNDLILFLNYLKTLAHYGSYEIDDTTMHVGPYLLSQLLKNKSSLGGFDQFLAAFVTIQTELIERTSIETAQLIGSDLEEISLYFEDHLIQNTARATLLEKHSSIFSYLSPHSLVKIFEAELGQRLKIVSSTSKKQTALDFFAELKTKFYIHTRDLGSYETLVEKSVSLAELQPSDLSDYLKTVNNGTLLTGTYNYKISNALRKMNGLMEYYLRQSAEGQFELIQYLLDLKSELPSWFLVDQKILSHNREAGNFLNQIAANFQKLKFDFLRSSDETKTLTLSFFLKGNRSLLSKIEGEKLIQNQILISSNPKDKDIILAIWNAIKHTESEFYSLLASRGLVKSIREESTDKKLKSSSSLYSLIVPLVEYFDMPGIKIAQLLSFLNSDGPNAESDLNRFYENAVPMSDSEVLKRLNEVYNNQFPKHWKYVKALGFGSVNFAVLIENLQNKEQFVLNIPRANIQTISTSSFTRFDRFLKTLEVSSSAIKNEELSSLVQTLRGVGRFVQRSVQNEFDRKKVFSRTQMAATIYSDASSGWTIKSVNAHSLDNQNVIKMDLAGGISLANLQKGNPKLYLKSLKLISSSLSKRLFNSKSNIRLATNGDWHPGQFFVDHKSKQITLIDFGQESEISEKELKLAKDFSILISNSEFPEKLQLSDKDLFNYLKNSLKDGFGFNLNDSEFDKVSIALTAKSKIEKFIKLLSVLENVNFEVPVASGNWIKELNAIMTMAQNSSNSSVIDDIKNEIGSYFTERVKGFKNFKMYKARLVFGELTSKLFGSIGNLFSDHNQTQTLETKNSCRSFYTSTSKR